MNGYPVARDEVPTADLGRVQAQSIRKEVERPLHGEDGKRHADTAIRAERRLVGRDGHALVGVGGRAVRARQDRARCRAARAPGSAGEYDRRRRRTGVAPAAPAARRSASAAASSSTRASRAWEAAVRFSRRVSIHFTGRPAARARATTARSSGITCIFWPKPPPVSGTMTRTRLSGRPKARASALR